MSKESLKKLGIYAFLGGVVIALVVGVVTGFMSLNSGTMGLVSGVMVVLGLIVGILNITDKEITSFIIAAIGLSVGSGALAGLGTILVATPATALVGGMLQTAFTIFGTFVAGAVFIPALKAVYKISKD